MANGFGYQQTQVMGKDEWLTPWSIIEALGPFDLDPCAPQIRPWETAKNYFTKQEDGLTQRWEGRVWLNPPYGKYVWTWMEKLSVHRNGLALIFARTGAQGFNNQVWQKAHTLLFINKRINFYHVDGTRAVHNSGGDSVLVAYDQPNSQILAQSGIKGKIILL